VHLWNLPLAGSLENNLGGKEEKVGVPHISHQFNLGGSSTADGGVAIVKMKSFRK